MRLTLAVRIVLLAVAAGAAQPEAACAADGKAVYQKTCAVCHASGVAGAPKLGDNAAWVPRLEKQGMAALVKSALNGKNAMPAKGGNAALTDAEVEAAVVYMTSLSVGSDASKAAAAAAIDAARNQTAGAATTAPGPAGATATPAVAAAAKKDQGTKTAGAGKSVYQATCAACHASGIAGAPKTGDGAAWADQIKAGSAALYQSALKGKNAMPPKGGNATLADAEVKAAVDYMVAQVKRAGSDAKPPVAASSAQRASPAPQSAQAPAGAATKQADATSEAAVKTSARATGKSTYDSTCAACHGAGLAGAPKLGDANGWAARIKLGIDQLYTSALKGKNAMPPKGGNAALTDADVKAAVDFMLAQVGGVTTVAKPGAAADQQASAEQPRQAAGPAPASNGADNAAANSARASPPTSSAPATAPAPVPTPATQTLAAADPNAFNRLFRAPGKRNLPPAEDGIHDPANDGTQLLQAPLQAFGTMVKSNTGNQVNWGQSLSEGKIQPRSDRLDERAEQLVLDMNIVREVKGSMPDVVFPHKQHTQWLDCANCHPAIFVPQKGANQISMAAILLGQKCGVCHGKIAFPVSECRLCHSKNKDVSTKVGEGKP